MSFLCNIENAAGLATFTLLSMRGAKQVQHDVNLPVNSNLVDKMAARLKVLNFLNRDDSYVADKHVVFCRRKRAIASSTSGLLCGMTAL
jgi:hypothetical protein